jgi:hypothetical protein
MEPTLSQITNIQGDANIAGGTAGPGGAAPAAVIYPQDTSLQYLQHAADAKSEANRYVSKMYADNLNKYMTNVNNIDMTNVMDTDLPTIRQKYADLASNIGNNYDVIRNPNVDPQKYGELQQQEAELRGQIAQSASHSAIQNYNKKVLLDHPEYNTPENQQQILNYASTSMGQRQNYLLNTPTTFDLQKTVSALAPQAAELTKKEAVSKGGNWLNTTEAKTYNGEILKNLVKSQINNSVINGRPVAQDWEKVYNGLPENLKLGTQNSNDYLDQIIPTLTPGGTQESTFTTNPYALQRQREVFEAGESAKQRALQDKALRKGEIKPEEAGEAKLRAYTNLMTNGTINPQYAQNVWGDNSSTVNKQVKIPIIQPDGSQGFETDKVKVPVIQTVGQSIDAQGNVHIQRIDNTKGGAPLPDLILNQNQIYSDMDNMLGPGYTGAISTGSHMYSKNNFNKVTPTVEDLQKHFNIGTDPNASIYKPQEKPWGILAPVAGDFPGKVTPPTIPTINTDNDYKALPSGTQYMAPDGKTYTKK